MNNSCWPAPLGPAYLSNWVKAVNWSCQSKVELVKLTPFVLVAFMAGCATASHDEREALLGKPIDCSTAEQDIAALEEALPSRRERARSAIQSVTPVGVVTGVATGSYGERAAVLTGRTEDELVARIDEIKATCALKDLTSQDTE